MLAVASIVTGAMTEVGPVTDELSAGSPPTQAKATAGLRAGDVVLLRDADRYSAPGSWVRTAALSKILEGLEELGLRSRLLRRGGAATTVH